MNKNMNKFGYNDFYNKQQEKFNIDLVPARITAVFQGQYEIATDFGTSSAVLKGSYSFNEDNYDIPTVGDFVMADYQDNGVSVIKNIMERKSSLIRKAPNDSSKDTQIIAANIDFAFVVMSLNKDFSTERLIRYTTAIYDGGITPVIILSKSDLVENETEINGYIARVNEVVFGTDVLVCSTYTNEGIDEILDFLREGNTYVFLGSSGVGKSSLLNALAGNEMMTVSDIREDDDKGKHTTTHRQLFMLDNGAMIIDTPGMREFGLADADSGLSESFADIEALAQQCYFKDCTHNTEPKCAVKDAIQRGEISEQRLISYNKHKRVEAFFERRGAKGTGSQRTHEASFSKMIKTHGNSRKKNYIKEY